MAFLVEEDGLLFSHADGPLPRDPPCRLPCHEWIYLVSGDAECAVDYRVSAVKPHTLILLRPGQLRRLLPRSGKPVNRYVLRFPEEAVPPPARSAFQGLGSQYVVPGTLISEEIQRMDFYVADLPADRIGDALRHQLSLLIHFACNFIANRQRAVPAVTSCGQLIEYIDAHLTGIRSLSDISLGVHLSPSSIQKMIRSELHKPVMTYVREQKCLLARNHLLKGFPAGDVCMQCGFSSYPTFYRAYLRTFGVPPSGDLPPAGGRS